MKRLGRGMFLEALGVSGPVTIRRDPQASQTLGLAAYGNAHAWEHDAEAMLSPEIVPGSRRYLAFHISPERHRDASKHCLAAMPIYWIGRSRQ
jgi:hypothetical protein